VQGMRGLGLSFGCALLALSSLATASAQSADGGCKPVSERTGVVGCRALVLNPSPDSVINISVL
jgi:hypothetical protein